MGRTRAGVLVAAVASGVGAIAAISLPRLHAFRLPALHVALETTASLVALLTAFLMAGRFHRYRRLDEIALVCALALFTVSNLVPVSALAIAGQTRGGLTMWLALTNRSLGAVLFAAAAFLPHRRPRRTGPVAAVAALITTVVLIVGLSVGEATWPVAQELAHVRPGASDLPTLARYAALLALQLAAAVLYAIAAIGFLIRARRHGDEFLAWVALAAVLALASHIHYFLYPSLYSQWVYTGDVFRIASYVALLAGSVQEIRSYWHALALTAVAEERHRIARDLHDGVSQELAYLVRNLDSVKGTPGAGVLARLRQSAERAQFESRRAIGELTAPVGQAAEAALASAAGDIAKRFQVGLDLDLADGVLLPDSRADALLRIACEAVANAARHSGASQVSLQLERDGTRVRLRVSDTGRGFDATLRAAASG